MWWFWSHAYVFFTFHLWSFIEAWLAVIVLQRKWFSAACCLKCCHLKISWSQIISKFFNVFFFLFIFCIKSTDFQFGMKHSGKPIWSLTLVLLSYYAVFPCRWTELKSKLPYPPSFRVGLFAIYHCKDMGVSHLSCIQTSTLSGLKPCLVFDILPQISGFSRTLQEDACLRMDRRPCYWSFFFLTLILASLILWLGSSFIECISNAFYYFLKLLMF